MEKSDDRRRYSNSLLWITTICGILLTVILLESLCLAILYVDGSLKGRDNNLFAREHILTRPFASIPAGPVPGKLFLGHLASNRRTHWVEFMPADGLLGWRLAPNISAYYKAYPEASEDLIVTDENGFSSDVNDPPVALQKSSNSYRVIVLGGSTVMGVSAQQPSLNIVGMLRKGVRVRGLTGPNGKSVEFINAGVMGYTSPKEYLYFGDLLRFKPDLVIVYDGLNDHDIKNLGPTLFRALGERAIAERVEPSSSIARLARLLAGNLKYSATEGDLRVGMIELPWRVLQRVLHKRVEGAPDTVSPFDPRSLEYYRISHRAFLALADDQLSVAIFLQPMVGIDGRELSNEEKTSWWYRPKFDDRLSPHFPFYEGARGVIADLKEEARNNIHVCIADVSRSVTGITEPIYADSGHLLPKGNEIVASHILDRLVSCGLLQQGFATLN